MLLLLIKHFQQQHNGCHVKMEHIIPALKRFYSKITKCTTGRARDYHKPSKQTKGCILISSQSFFFGVFACNISTAFQMHLRSIWLTHLFCAEDNSSSWSMNWLVTCILTPMLWEVINPVSSILPTRTLYTTKGNSALDLSLKRSSMWFNTRVYASVYASVRGA